MEIKITIKQKKLMKDIKDLYRLILVGKKEFNYYEKQLIEIIEEYEHYIDYKKEWIKRND